MTRLTAREKRLINKGLDPILKQTYFEEIPLKSIWEVLSDHGVVVLQEDGTEWSGLLLGREGSEYLDIAKSAQETFEGRYLHKIENCTLNLSWYKMPSGRYEVLCYVA